MDPLELYNLLSDVDVNNEVTDILVKAFSTYLETERYYERFNPLTKKKEGDCETVNITEVLLRINNNLERIANRLEGK